MDNNTIEIKLHTGKNIMTKWEDVKPLRFNVQTAQEGEQITRRIVRAAQIDRPDDNRIEARWNWVGSFQGHYVS